MTNGKECKIDGCASPSKTRGMCNKHYLRWWTATKNAEREPAVGKVAEPLRPRIERQAERQADGCLLWTGHVNKHGYGQIKVGGVTRPAHIVSYEEYVGPVPDGLELDHLCHTNDQACPGGVCQHRRCIEPSHLEPVTQRTNLLRARGFVSANAAKTHCINGHPYDEENTIYANGRRICRECRKDIWKRSNDKRRAGPKPERTHCKNGHPWIDENVYVSPRGLKTCRVCTREAQARFKERHSDGG